MRGGGEMGFGRGRSRGVEGGVRVGGRWED